MIFESEKGQFYVGFANQGELLPEIAEMKQCDHYDPAHAREVMIDKDVWDGKLTERVIISA